MFRITVRESKDAAKKYYTEKARQDYYAQGQEMLGSWGGKGAARLGLKGEVGAKQFIALCDNLNPNTDKTLTARNSANRIPGYDLNFHCPKSVSVVYMWTGDERIMRAFREAVKETMEQVESWVKTRVRKGGADSTRETGNLIWAEFVHLTARPEGKLPDPHLHAHCFTFNATYDDVEQQWKAAHIRDLYDNAPFFQAAFLLRLSNNLNAIGYATQPVAKAFEIVGAPEEVNKQFSKRTIRIKETAKRLGITDPHLLDKLGAMTRKAKLTEVSYPELRKLWKGEVSEEHREALDRFLKPALRPQLGKHPLEKPVTASELASIRKAHEGEQITATSALTLLSPSGKAPPKPRVQADPDLERKALDRSILHNFYRKSVVTEEEILTQAIARAYGAGITLKSMEKAMRAHPEFIFKTIDGQRRVTTRSVLAEERLTVRWVKAGMGTCPPLIEGYKIRDKELNEEQQAAVLHVLRSRDRVTAIEGKSGVGKTRLMVEAVGALQDAHIPVLVMAPSTLAVEETLLKRGFPEAQTVEQLLVNKQLQEKYRGGVLWVDEAGMISGRSMTRLFALADEMGARIVTTGDTGQHRAVERGDAMRTLYKYADLKPAVVSKIMRQRGDYKEWMELLAAGKVEEAFHAMDEGGAIHILPEHERYKAIAQMYLHRVREGRRPGMISPSHAEGRLVTEAIRKASKDDGELQGERSFRQLRRIDMTSADQADWHSYRTGWFVQFHNRFAGFERGTRYEIESVDPEDGSLYLKMPFAPTASVYHAATRRLDVEKHPEAISVFEAAEINIAPGERIRITQNGMPEYGKKMIKRGGEYTVTGFDETGNLKLDNGMVLGKDFGHLGYGYYRSSMGAQSMDVQHVIVAESPLSYPAGSREQFYVSVGRAKIRPDVFGADKEHLLEAILPSSRRFSAMEFIDAKPDDELTPGDALVYLREAQERAPLKEHLGRRKDLPRRDLDQVKAAPLKQQLGSTPEPKRKAPAHEEQPEPRQAQGERSPMPKPAWQLPTILPPVESNPMKKQLGQKQEVPAKLDWMLPAVLPSPEGEQPIERQGEKQNQPKKLEWKWPAQQPKETTPKNEENEPDLDEGIEPEM